MLKFLKSAFKCYVIACILGSMVAFPACIVFISAIIFSGVCGIVIGATIGFVFSIAYIVGGLLLLYEMEKNANKQA